MSEPFIGEIRILPYNFAPRGWALCNGQLINISENSTLFAIIGTTYGGNGVTNFQLPNLQGSAVMGSGNSPSAGINSYPGMRGGSAVETLTTDEMPKHTHQVLVDDVDATLATPSANTLAKGGVPGARGSTVPFNAYSNTQAANQLLSSEGIGNVGGSQPHENRQPFLATSYCIALDGLFPSRS